MIFDTIDNLEYYSILHPAFADAADFIRENDLSMISEGRYELPGGAYVSVDSYMTREAGECMMECHRKYIDIQMVASGMEIIETCSVKQCSSENYNEKKDFQKLEGPADALLVMSPGYFAVFFPGDAHRPQIQADDESEKVKKIVFKLPVSEMPED